MTQPLGTRRAPLEDVETVERELSKCARPASRLTLDLGWTGLRVSAALMVLWARGRAEVDVGDPYEWRLTDARA